MLMENISKDELMSDLCSFNKNRSPRLDGWPMEFYMFFFYILVEDLLRVVAKV
jgi:hypothetical protein